MTRCAATIWKRNIYHRTGRGNDDFEIHSKRYRCEKKATNGKWCSQHDATHTHPNERDQ